MINQYTYKITNVNKEVGAMEITFSALGYPDVLVGARLPYVDEDLDTLVASFAPHTYWESLNKVVADIQVGHSGTIILPETPVLTYTESVSTITPTSGPTFGLTSV